MNGFISVPPLKVLVAASCLLAACLVARPGSAPAMAMYDAEVYVAVWPGFYFPPQPLPPGISSNSFVSSSLGFASASGSAGFSSAYALAFGQARAPYSSFNAQFGSAVIQGELLNQNTAPVDFPMTVEHESYMLADAGEPGLRESARGHLSYAVLFDGSSIEGDNFGCDSHCYRLDEEYYLHTYLLSLTPGPHSLLITVEADAFATSILEPVPEPTTLLLFGSTIAGLGLGRWRQNRRKRDTQDGQG